MSSRFLLAALLATTPALVAQSLAGLWDATVTVNGVEIPFRMEFSGAGSGVKASFFNGDEKNTSSGGRFENGSLLASFDYYNSRLEATWKDGRLGGAYVSGARLEDEFYGLPGREALYRERLVKEAAHEL